MGVLIREHGCTDHSILFLESGEGGDVWGGGKAWAGDICEVAEIEDWEEDGDMMRC